MSVFNNNHLIISMLFTLSVGICLFMYIHQRYNRVEKKVNTINSHLVQWIERIQQPVSNNQANTEDLSDDEVDESDSDNEHGYDENNHNHDNSHDVKTTNVLNSGFTMTQNMISIHELNPLSGIVEVTDADKIDISDDEEERHETKNIIIDQTNDLNLDNNESESEDLDIPDYHNMQVSSLRELIKSLDISIKSINKYKKSELIKLLDNFYENNTESNSKNVVQLGDIYNGDEKSVDIETDNVNDENEVEDEDKDYKSDNDTKEDNIVYTVNNDSLLDTEQLDDSQVQLNDDDNTN